MKLPLLQGRETCLDVSYPDEDSHFRGFYCCLLRTFPAVDGQVRRSLSRLVSGATGNDVPLAAFDADGTLWDGDSAEIFMEWMDSSNRWSQHGDFVARCY